MVLWYPSDIVILRTRISGPYGPLEILVKNGVSAPCATCPYLAVCKVWPARRTRLKKNSLNLNKQTQKLLKTTITSINHTNTFQESARTMQVDPVGRVFLKTMRIPGTQTPRMTMGWVPYLPIGRRLTPTKGNRTSSIITQVFGFFFINLPPFIIMLTLWFWGW